MWDGCAQSDNISQERVQLSAARIVTGQLLITEPEGTGWETIAKCQGKEGL